MHTLHISNKISPSHYAEIIKSKLFHHHTINIIGLEGAIVIAVDSCRILASHNIEIVSLKTCSKEVRFKTFIKYICSLTSR